MNSLRFILFGVLFGFILSRVGATDFEAIRGMFLLTDLHLMGVIGVAVAVAGTGFALIRRSRLADAAILHALERKPVTAGAITGGLIFGVGWALTGTCPGTALSQIGEGNLAGLITAAGILAGSGLYARLGTADASHDSGLLADSASAKGG